MKVIEQNILDVNKGIIFSQVNCQGKMNSGLARSIREKWPVVYDRYIAQCQRVNADFLLLGKVQNIPVSEGLFVFNIFGQYNFGYDKIRYTDYGALKTAFKSIKDDYNDKVLNNLYFPYNFGCDRGGADWNVVSKMIDYYFPSAIICKLPEKKQCNIHTFTTTDKCGCQ